MLLWPRSDGGIAAVGWRSGGVIVGGAGGGGETHSMKYGFSNATTSSFSENRNSGNRKCLKPSGANLLWLRLVENLEGPLRSLCRQAGEE